MDKYQEFSSLTNEEKITYVMEFNNFHRQQIDKFKINNLWREKYEKAYGKINSGQMNVDYRIEYENVVEFFRVFEKYLVEYRSSNSIENLYNIFEHAIANKNILDRFTGQLFYTNIKFKIFELHCCCNNIVKDKMKIYFYKLYDKHLCFDHDILVYCMNNYNSINKMTYPLLLKEIDSYLSMKHNGNMQQ